MLSAPEASVQPQAAESEFEEKIILDVLNRIKGLLSCLVFQPSSMAVVLNFPNDAPVHTVPHVTHPKHKVISIATS